MQKNIKWLFYCNFAAVIVPALLHVYIKLGIELMIYIIKTVVRLWPAALTVDDDLHPEIDHNKLSVKYNTVDDVLACYIIVLVLLSIPVWNSKIVYSYTYNNIYYKL